MSILLVLRDLGIDKNKNAAKELAQYLLEHEQVEERTTVVEGFNLPPQISMSDVKVWSEVGR